MNFVRCTAVLLLAASLPSGSAADTPPAAAPEVEGSLESRCVELGREDFSAVPEAATQIIGARIVAARDRMPAACEISGVVMPNVGFRAELPVAGWNGKFFLAGCGNYCGVLNTAACEDPVRRGYACIVTDSGHTKRSADVAQTDGEWAYDNLAAQLDYGGRASHVTAVAGKALTSAFYGKPPSKSYFIGCSYGGHQGLVLAQRFPWDFDGIVAGGAPTSISGLMQQNVWSMTHLYDTNMRSVLSETDIRVLHDAVLARCDMDDGVKDRLVSNPSACKINVDALICRAGAPTECLSAAAATAVKNAYAGPSTSAGVPLTAGGWSPGSELHWREVYRPDGVGLVALAPNYFRYMGRFPASGPGWSVKNYDFDQDYRRNDVAETLYAAANPDLRRFKAAGGKLINYAGWADLGTVPAMAIDYYETVQRTLGGRIATEEFFRLFMIPGALHCRGGEGPNTVDYLTYLEAWVERGVAPDRMLARHLDEEGNTTFTRPLYPYPRYAKYKGSGNPADAANFKAVGGDH